MKIYIVIRRGEIFLREINKKVSPKESRVDGYIAFTTSTNKPAVVLDIGTAALKHKESKDVYVCAPFDHPTYSYFDPAIAELFFEEILRRFTSGLRIIPPFILVQPIELKNHEFKEMELRGLREMLIHSGAKMVITLESQKRILTNAEIIELLKEEKNAPIEYNNERPQSAIN